MAAHFYTVLNLNLGSIAFIWHNFVIQIYLPKSNDQTQQM